jgi:hypothetical protein
MSVLSLALPAAAQARPRTIHVFVALADNRSQGIVPVAATLGNGDDPGRNLYWGSAYGVKTYFSRSAEWQMISSGQKPKAEILELFWMRRRAARRKAYPSKPAAKQSSWKHAVAQTWWLMPGMTA